MEYNKNKFTKTVDRKRLHKIKKQWVVVSTAMLMALGAGTLVTHSVHAAANPASPNDDNHQTMRNASSASAQQSTVHPQLSAVSHNSQGSVTHESSVTSAIDQQAHDLHQQILQNGLKSSVSSASVKQSVVASQMMQPRSLASSQSTVMPTYSQVGAKLTASPSNNNMIIVNYVNQARKTVKHFDISGGTPKTPVDVTSTKNGAIPQGYDLDPGVTTVAYYSTGVQTVTIPLRGKQITQDNDEGKNKVTINITEDSGGAPQTKSIPYYVTGHIGDTKRIDPGTYLPDGYYAASSDIDHNVTINSDGTVSPNNFSFTYDKNGVNPEQLYKIFIHYCDINHSNQEIPGSTLSDAGTPGEPFMDLKNYIQLVPNQWYYTGKTIPSDPGTKMAFSTQPQNVKVLVAKRDAIQYVDASDNNDVIRTNYITPTDAQNGALNQNQYKNKIPKGFNFKSFGKWNSAFQSGGINQVIVGRQPNVQPNCTINIVYLDEDNHNKQVGSDTEIKPQNTPFTDLSTYYSPSKVPSGYTYDKLLSSVPSSFSTNPATVKLGVNEDHKNNSDNGNKTVTVTLEYDYYHTHKQIAGTTDQKISGKPGDKIQYGAFTNSSVIDKISDPNKGMKYQYAGLASDDDQKFPTSNGDISLILLKEVPIHQKTSDGTLQVTYIYHPKNGVSDNEGTATFRNLPAGQPVNSDQIKKSIPNGFTFASYISGQGFLSSMPSGAHNLFVAINKSNSNNSGGNNNTPNKPNNTPNKPNNNNGNGGHNTPNTPSDNNNGGHNTPNTPSDNKGNGGHNTPNNPNNSGGKNNNNNNNGNGGNNSTPNKPNNTPNKPNNNGGNGGNNTPNTPSDNKGNGGHNTPNNPNNNGGKNNNNNNNGKGGNNNTPNKPNNTPNNPNNNGDNGGHRPNPNPEMGQIKVHYKFKGKDLSDVSIYGTVGSQVTKKQLALVYSKKPVGYEISDIKEKPMHFSKGVQDVDVTLKEGQVNIVLQYENANGYAVLKTLPETGENGQKIDYTTFVNQVPQILPGYHYFSSNVNNDPVYKQGDTAVIYVSQNSSSNNNNNNNGNNNNQVTMTIQYVDAHNAVVQTRPVSGTAGASFNVDSYGVPSGYKFVSDLGIEPTVFTANGVAMVKVAPLGQSNNNDNGGSSSNNTPTPNSNGGNNYTPSSNGSNGGNGNTPTSSSNGNGGSNTPATSNSDNGGSSTPSTSGSNYNGNSSSASTPGNSDGGSSASAPTSGTSSNGSDGNNSSASNNGSNSDVNSDAQKSNSDSGGQMPNSDTSDQSNHSKRSSLNPQKDGNGGDPVDRENQAGTRSGGNENVSSPDPTAQEASASESDSGSTGTLPQTNEDQRVGQILMVIGSTLTALGYAFDRRKRHDE